ncbi:MAG TPA: SRPBCC family protein [Dongiaceae bacterium]|nr:SRPBCC family protein [Dongiaceae bacterium]
MTRIVSSATIHRAPEDVFDYVTTPAKWKEWHPSTMRVDGGTHPLEAGETCTEEFVVAGRRGVCDWIVTRRERPALWEIESRRSSGGSATITYELVPSAGGTRFTRTLQYRMPNAVLSLLDALVFRRRIERESATAVDNVRGALEAAQPAAV